MCHPYKLTRHPAPPTHVCFRRNLIVDRSCILHAHDTGRRLYTTHIYDVSVCRGLQAGGVPVIRFLAAMTTEIAAVWTAWDAACSHFMRDKFAKLGFSELLSPPAKPVADLPFVASPTVLVTSILVYLVVVVGSILLKSIQKTEIKRDNAAIRAFVQAHNVFLVGLSTYMFTGILYEAYSNGYSFWGNEYSPKETGMSRMIYIFYVSKMYEFMDTFIMILKGNMRQVSFLHVYHHLTISVIWWSITYVAPGGDAYYSAALNSLVHVVMYAYYLLASALGKDERLRRKYLWWGRFLTMFQMTQFVTMVCQATYCLVMGAYNQFLARLLFFYMLSLLALFGQFYIQKYSKGAARKTNGKNGSSRNGNGNSVDGATIGAAVHAAAGVANGKSKAT
eukprot:jgi/Ulvmu1/12106/UM084_0031.1